MNDKMQLLNAITVILLSVCTICVSYVTVDLETELNGGYVYVAENITGVGNGLIDFSRILIRNNNIYVSTQDNLVLLNTSLDFISKYTPASAPTTDPRCSDPSLLPLCFNYFRLILYLTSTSSLYVCYTNFNIPKCAFLDPNTLTEESNAMGNRPPYEPTSVFISPSGPSILLQRNFAVEIPSLSGIAVGSQFSDQDEHRIAYFAPTTETFTATTDFDPSDPKTAQNFFPFPSFAERTFIFNMEDGTNSFLYLMFYENANDKITQISTSMIGRTCIDEAFSSNMIQTFVKLPLKCGNFFPSLVQDFYPVANGSKYQLHTVFSTFTEGPVGSFICIFDIGPSTTASTNFNAVKTGCTRNTIESGTGIDATPILHITGELVSRIQLKIFTLGSSSYTFYFLSTNQGNVLKYCYSCPTIPLIESMRAIPLRYTTNRAIESMVITDEYLYAGGYHGLFRVPFETCALKVFPQNCIDDPFCYWDLSSISCVKINIISGVGTVPSNFLHYSTLNALSNEETAQCQSITAKFYINRNTAHNLTIEHTCNVSRITAEIHFQNLTTDVHQITSSSVNIFYTYNHTNVIESITYRPFNFYTVNAAFELPGTSYTGYVEYIKEPISNVNCTPTPPICIMPVCIDYNNMEVSECLDDCDINRVKCSYVSNGCFDLREYIVQTYAATSIDYSQSFTVNGGLSASIQVNQSTCGVLGCHLVLKTTNTTTGIYTMGPTFELHLKPALSSYTPTITYMYYYNNSENMVEVTASLSELTTNNNPARYYCENLRFFDPGTNKDYPMNLTFNECSLTVLAIASSRGSMSMQISMNIEASQIAIAPTILVPSLTNQNKTIEFIVTDILLSWTTPNYKLHRNFYSYTLFAQFCTGNNMQLPIMNTTSYFCPGVTLRYNTSYSFRVSSIEPCLERDAMSAKYTFTTNTSAPSAPQVLSYDIINNYAYITWLPPKFKNSQNNVIYDLQITSELCSDNSLSMPVIPNQTDTNYTLQLVPGYSYSIILYAFTSFGYSQNTSTVIQTQPPANRTDAFCGQCKILDSNFSINTFKLSWDITTPCISIDSFSIVEYYRITSAWNETNRTTLNQNDRSSIIAFNTSMYEQYRICISINISDTCELKGCNSRTTCTYIITPTTMQAPAPAPVAHTTTTAPPVSSSIDQCQDNKSFVIIGLAAVAIGCAIVNVIVVIISCLCFYCTRPKKN